MDTALADPTTDAIVLMAASVQVADGLAGAKAKDVPVVIIQPDEDPMDGNFVAVGGPDSYRLNGQLLANYVLSKSERSDRAMFVGFSAISSLKIVQEAFVDEWKKNCPDWEEPVVYDAPIDSLG